MFQVNVEDRNIHLIANAIFLIENRAVYYYIITKNKAQPDRPRMFEYAEMQFAFWIFKTEIQINQLTLISSDRNL